MFIVNWHSVIADLWKDIKNLVKVNKDIRNICEWGNDEKKKKGKRKVKSASRFQIPVSFFFSLCHRR